MICVDEKSKQLLRETRCALPAKPAVVAKQDYEYERAGFGFILVAAASGTTLASTAQTAHVTTYRATIDNVKYVYATVPPVAHLKPGDVLDTNTLGSHYFPRRKAHHSLGRGSAGEFGVWHRPPVQD